MRVDRWSGRIQEWSIVTWRESRQPQAAVLSHREQHPVHCGRATIRDSCQG
jgi:hypothetical protein